MPVSVHSKRKHSMERKHKHHLYNKTDHTIIITPQNEHKTIYSLLAPPLLFPLGAGCNAGVGVCRYVTVLVTTCRTLRDGGFVPALRGDSTSRSFQSAAVVMV